jgi:hypothetical protein
MSCNFVFLLSLEPSIICPLVSRKLKRKTKLWTSLKDSLRLALLDNTWKFPIQFKKHLFPKVAADRTKVETKTL